MKTEKNIYFVSDAHLGADLGKSSEEREILLISWLNEIKDNASEIYLLGDIFDFWYEFKYFVPKNFVVFLAKLRELSDNGIKINFFTGNHDMWTFGYLAEICKLNVFYNVTKFTINEKKIFIGHGDGLGNYDKKYIFIKKIFKSKFCQFIFKTIHPSISFRIANAWSKSNRKKHKYTKPKDINDEYLIKYAREVLKTENIDFFIFGHRHIPLQTSLSENCIYTNIGDWLINFTYGIFDGEKIFLEQFKQTDLLENKNNG